MNKGTGMASPTNGQNKKSTAGRRQKIMRTWMCAQRRYRKKKTQDTISGNGQRWACESHADNGDNDVAKMQNEKLTRS